MIPAMRVARKPDSAHGTEPSDRRKPWALRATALAAAVLVSACTSFGVIDNKPLLSGEDRPGYTLETFNRTLNQRSDELSLAVAFSGGGTRAAALAYGVMQELRDTRVRLQGTERSLLEAVNVISSVSGGSFTSAYYGLYGNRLFEDFEARFLRRNIEGALLRSLFNPLQWFSSHDRTETAVSYYKENLFGEATFSDLIRKNAPLILINTSDLASGERFVAGALFLGVEQAQEQYPGQLRHVLQRAGAIGAAHDVADGFDEGRQRLGGADGLGQLGRLRHLRYLHSRLLLGWGCFFLVHQRLMLPVALRNQARDTGVRD